MINGLPTITVPQYDLILPSSKKKIKFRPFVVREEKLLLIALQEEDTSKISTAIKRVLSNCSFGADIDNMAQIDAEYLFLQIRNKSMGEGIDAMSTCIHCDHKNFMSLDLSKVKIIEPDKKIHNVIEISPKLWLTMRHPTLDDSYDLAAADSSRDILEIVAKCIVNIVNDEVVINPKDHPLEQMVAWLDDLQDQHITIITDFLSNVPTMRFEQEYNCTSCGNKNLILLEGLESFFG